MGAYPIFWGTLAVALGVIVVFLRMQRIDPFDEDDADRTETRR
jgi:hypothetical protein